QLLVPNEPYDALNQVWAGGQGGIGSSNSPLAEVQREVHLGDGSFTWRITDLERKFNINLTVNPAYEPVLQQALIIMGVDAGELPAIVGSIQDWIDRDDETHIEGSESDYYQGLD